MHDYEDALREVLNRVYRNTDDCEMRLVHNAGEGWIMDIEKPVKVALDSAVMVVGDACGTVDVSAATLTDMVEMVKSVKATNDKFYEIIYKDGNLEMEEIK